MLVIGQCHLNYPALYIETTTLNLPVKTDLDLFYSRLHPKKKYFCRAEDPDPAILNQEFGSLK